MSTKRHPFLLGLLLMAGIAFWLLPSSWLAAPHWQVVVVDKNGKPIEGMTVRETWQNYSVESEEHEADRLTDANGRVSFPAQVSQWSIPRQIAGTVSALAHFNVHASYGPHAAVFAFGKDLEGAPTDGFFTDWTGFPPLMRSRIVVEPMILPSSKE